TSKKRSSSIPSSRSPTARGYAYAGKGDSKRAAQELDQAVQLSPNQPAAFNDRGMAYGLQGDNDRAIGDYDQAIKLDGKYALAYNNRAVAYAAKGQAD